MRFLGETYTQHQVMNKWANNIFSGIVEFVMYLSAFVLTLFLYGLFRLARNSYIIIQCIIVSLALIIFYFLKNSLLLAASCHIDSVECCTIGRWSIAGGKIENRHWRACKPTSVSVGSHFALKSKNYVLQVFGKIIFENVVNLLVTF